MLNSKNNDLKHVGKTGKTEAEAEAWSEAWSFSLKLLTRMYLLSQFNLLCRHHLNVLKELLQPVLNISQHLRELMIRNRPNTKKRELYSGYSGYSDLGKTRLQSWDISLIISNTAPVHLFYLLIQHL